jgi:hypothetical protein
MNIVLKEPTMQSLKKHMRWFAGPMAAVMFVTTSGIGTAHAGLVATDEAAEQQVLAADRAELLAALDRQDVRDQLVALGVAPAEAAARINAMSDVELAQVMDQVNSMPAGEGALGFVIGVALIVLVVFLVTDALDVTDVY